VAEICFYDRHAFCRQNHEEPQNLRCEVLDPGDHATLFSAGCRSEVAIESDLTMARGACGAATSTLALILTSTLGFELHVERLIDGPRGHALTSMRSSKLSRQMRQMMPKGMCAFAWQGALG